MAAGYGAHRQLQIGMPRCMTPSDEDTTAQKSSDQVMKWPPEGKDCPGCKMFARLPGNGADVFPAHKARIIIS